VPDDPMEIDVAPQGSTDRSTRRRRGPRALMIGAAVVAAGLVILVIALLSNKAEVATNQTPRQGRAVVESERPESEAEIADVHAQGIADDGKTLWISPTSGTPLDLTYAPLGTQLLLHVRPAALASHPEGGKALAALGPWGEWAIAQVEKYSGAKLQEISSLLVALYPQENGGLGCTLRLQLLEPLTNEMLAQRLPGSKAAIYAKQPCRVVGDWACFLPKSDAGSTLVVCAARDAAELIASGISPPPLPRDLQRLADRTDADRIATLLFPTNFFRAGGSELLQGTAKPLVTALQQIVGGDTTTVALSLHWDENFFVELQSTVAQSKRPHRFVAAVAERLSKSPGELEGAIADTSHHPYGQEVLVRFPAMMRQLSNYTRVGSERGLSVVRCYLPSSAGHNLLMAAELMLNSSQEAGQGGLASSSSPAARLTGKTIAEALERPTTLSFPKETLQKTLQMLSEDLGVAIELRGRDLQLEGITKNQSFAIDLREQKAGEILLAILELANPDRAATGPNDLRQKLVYVVREAVDGRPGAIVVTTRAAAAKRNERLPVVFRPIEQ